MRLPQFILIALAIGTIAISSAQRTTRRGLDKSIRSAVQRPTAPMAHYDTIFTPQVESIKLSGYDKPLNATKETMLLTNQSDKHLYSISLKCCYLDINSRQLHQRDVVVSCDIPAGETRMISFPSWDTQKSYYYSRSRKPRSGVATPYNISCTVNYVVTTLDHDNQ